MNRRTIWTDAALAHLFELIVKKFGDATQWAKEGRHYLPGRGLDRQYTDFINDFQKLVGAESFDAVNFYPHWAQRPDVPNNPRLAAESDRAKKAAEKAGFLPMPPEEAIEERKADNAPAFM